MPSLPDTGVDMLVAARRRSVKGNDVFFSLTAVTDGELATGATARWPPTVPSARLRSGLTTGASATTRAAMAATAQQGHSRV